MAHRDVVRLARRRREGDAHQAGAHGAQLRRLRVEGEGAGVGQAAGQLLQLLLTLDGAVVHFRRLNLDDGWGRRLFPSQPGGEASHQAAELQLPEEAQDLLPVEGLQLAGLQVQVYGGIGDDCGHALAVAGLLLVLAQVVPQLLGLHLLQVLVEVLHAPELLHQLGRRLLADAGHAGDVVRGVTLEALEVGHLVRLDAVALAGPLLVVDDGVALVGAVHVDADAGPHELHDVAIQGHQVGLEALRRRLAGQGAQDIVGLVPLDATDGDVEGLDELLAAGDLLVEVLRGRRPVGLVGLVLLMAKGGARRVQGDGHVGGLQLLQHAQQRVGEAVDGAHGLPRPPHGQGLVAQGVVGAVNDAVAVQDHQQGLPLTSHCAAIIASRPGACVFRWLARDRRQAPRLTAGGGTIPRSRKPLVPFDDHR